MTGPVLLVAAEAALWFGHPRLRRWHLGGWVPLSKGGALRHTNATFWQPATKALHPTGRAHPWYWQSYARRAMIRATGFLMVLIIEYSLLTAPVPTIAMLGATALALACWGMWRLFVLTARWQHRRHYVTPVRRTLIERTGAAPLSIDVKRAGKLVTAVKIKWPPADEIGTINQATVLDVVTTRLAIEAPVVDWQTRGRDREVTYKQSPPPPDFVTWDDVAGAVARAGGNDWVFGLGKAGGVVEASLSQDSPHAAVSGGSGGGKSNLAAFLFLQELARGAILFNLDPKWISHLWLQGLPNVVNAHEIPQLHTALCWLGGELLRRTKVAYHSSGGTGRVRANVGPRVIVGCEELNYAIPDLKDHWSDIRGKDQPKKSPALKALSALSCAGRASDIHLLLLAQMLTAASTGVSDSSVRGNAGIKCMARYDPNNWGMVVGRHIPMPPEPTVPGRIQVVTARGVNVTQVPYLRLDREGPEGEKAVRWAREFAVSGKVAELPLGGEFGLPPELWPPGAATVLGQTDSFINAGQGPETGDAVSGLPPHPVTLREATDAGILPMTLGAARKASQRDGFPEPLGRDGKADLYDPGELQAWQAGKVKVNR